MTLYIQAANLDSIASILNAHVLPGESDVNLASRNPLGASDWFRLGILAADQPFAWAAEEAARRCVAIGADDAGNRLYHLKGVAVQV